MTAAEVARTCRAGVPHWQLVVNELIDDFRAGDAAVRQHLVHEPPDSREGPFEGLVAAVVSALCREVGMAPPRWVGETRSATPFFAFPARGYALRVRLMLESPPPFRARNVFVPSTYLARA